MQNIKVWDRFVRIFHWSLVTALIIQLISAETSKSTHVTIGIFIVLLVATRIVWGFVGSEHARFADFIYSPGEIVGYLKGLFTGNPKHYLGHNPAGGAMVLSLLAVLLLTCFAGLKTYGAQGKGPLSQADVSVVSPVWADDEGADDDHGGHKRDHQRNHGEADDHGGVWKEVHEGLVGLLLVLAALHVCGVLASSYVHRENLIWSMVTGMKKVS